MHGSRWSARGCRRVVGPAGTGKTVAVGAAVREWQRTGIPVHGVALAAVAARRLERATGGPSMSLARFLATAPVDEAPTVVVVDEAGMVGTRQLTQLFERVHAVSGKVVLVGDPGQLPEVEAGGLFSALVRDRVTTEPSPNRRQAAAWEPAALLHLRDGQLSKAIAAVDHRGGGRTTGGSRGRNVARSGPRHWAARVGGR
jgi:ATP-dependent exoDNAse (exonuclease V) alpha subunit